MTTQVPTVRPPSFVLHGIVANGVVVRGTSNCCTSSPSSPPDPVNIISEILLIRETMFNIPPAAVISFKVTVKDGQAHGARAAIMQQLDVVNCHRKPFSGNDSLKNNLRGEIGVI